MQSFEEIVELERRFLLQTYSRYPVAIERGKGVFLYDLTGKRYLDFVAGLGVNALGHGHPRIVRAIREQAARNSLVQSVLQRVPGSIGREALRFVWAAAGVLFEQWHGGD